MKQQVKQEYHPYNFDDDKEFAIYKYVCKLKINRKEKKLVKGFEFSTYDEWKEYVIEKYSHVSLKSLNDFHRNLRHKQKMAEAFPGAYTGILIPWLFMVFSIVLGSAVYEIYENKGVIFLVIIQIVSNCILAFGSLWILQRLLMEYIMSNKEVLLYSDYENIIQEMIESKDFDIKV